MEVSCPACAARYTADDAKLRGKTARMRCRACDTVWLVSGPPLDEGLTEKRAAVSRRGAEREKRDLFATQTQQEQVSAWETMRPPPPSHQPQSVPPPSSNQPRFETTLAMRNENSVLFKVTDVFGGATARMKTPEPSPAPSSLPPAKRDDSGVIDLKALSERPAAPIPRPVVAPLFGMSDPPPAAFARDAGASSSYPSQSSPVKSKLRSIGMVFAAAALVAGIGAGVTAMFKAGEPPPKAAAAPTPPEPPPPPAVTTPAPPPEPAPAATSSASDEKDKKDAKNASGKKGKRGRGGAAKAQSGVITNKSAPPPPPPKVKAADPCGCHGDFNCILACTAGKK